MRNTCRVGSGSIWPCRMRTSIGLGDYVREVVLLRCYSLGNGGIWPSMTRTNTCLEGSETMAVRGPRKRIFRPISCFSRNGTAGCKRKSFWLSRRAANVYGKEETEGSQTIGCTEEEATSRRTFEERTYSKENEVRLHDG